MEAGQQWVYGGMRDGRAAGAVLAAEHLRSGSAGMDVEELQSCCGNSAR